MLIHTALISHRHGTDFYVSRTEDGIYSKVADYCRQYWSELNNSGHTEEDADETAPPKDWSDKEIVAHYFEEHGTEGVDIGTADLED